MPFSSLKDRVVVVTGASRGLGEQIARRCAKEGAKVALVARDKARLEALAAELPGSAAIPADLMKTEDFSRLLAEVEAKLGPIDVLVNNAGIEITESFLKLKPEEADSILQTNLHAPINLTRLVLPGMLTRKSGVVVNVSSMSGKGPTPYNSIYAAAKHGINGFTSSVLLELAGTGVHIGVVCPGFVGGTGMWASTGLKAPWVLREVSPEDVVEAVLSVTRGAQEVLVTAGPIRPLLAIQELFPSLRLPLMERFGIVAALKARASR
jgi:short-subunit dehydrogenase